MGSWRNDPPHGIVHAVEARPLALDVLQPAMREASAKIGQSGIFNLHTPRENSDAPPELILPHTQLTSLIRPHHHVAEDHRLLSRLSRLARIQPALLQRIPHLC